MSELDIRPIEPGDEAQWRRLWGLYLEFYKTRLPEEVYQATFDRLLSDQDNEFCGLLALVDDQPVGITHYLVHRSCWSVDNVCYLQDLYVDPEHRGSGLGRALIEAVYRAADSASAPAVYWHTQHFNYAGRQLYDRVAKLTPFLRYDRET